MAKKAGGDIWIDGFNLFHQWRETAALFQPGGDVVQAQQLALRLLSRKLHNRRGRCVVFMDGGVRREAGTIDGVMRIEKDKYIADIKTSASVAPYAKLQLVAYLKIWNDNHPDGKIFKRMIIHLLPDGEYKLIRYPISDISRDFDIFLCKLKSAQWDAENMGERF